MVRHRSNASASARSLRQKERRQKRKTLKSNTPSGRYPTFYLFSSPLFLAVQLK
jgi:hypothetical protein